jgi:hypothetical protein
MGEIGRLGKHERQLEKLEVVKVEQPSMDRSTS